MAEFQTVARASEMAPGEAFDPSPIERSSNLRGGRNADLVRALAMAVWWGDKLTWADDVRRRRYEPKEERAGSHWAT